MRKALACAVCGGSAGAEVAVEDLDRVGGEIVYFVVIRVYKTSAINRD